MADVPERPTRRWPWATAARLGALALLGGLLYRLIGYLVDPSSPLRTCDGAAYWEMAKNLAAGNGLSIHDPHVAGELCSLPLGPSHHYSPLLPMLEAGFIVVLGPTTTALALCTVAITLATVATVTLLARDLWGTKAGFLAGGFVALEWTTTRYGSLDGYSENLVLLAIALTLWGILRSLEDERYILWAGLGAALGYLSKGSVGWFFLVAGFGGLAWRLAHRGWRGAFNRWYVAAILLFGSVVAAWTARNLAHFWDGTWDGLWLAATTSESTAIAARDAMHQPARLALALLQKGAFLLAVLLVPVAPLLPTVRARLKEWRDEATSAVWLAAVLVFAICWFLATALWIREGTRVWWADPVRYVAPAAFALTWLALGGKRAPSRAAWAATYAVEVAVLVAMPFLSGAQELLGSGG